MRFLSLLVGLFLSLSAAQAGWIKAESDHFIFYSDGNEKDLRADAIRLERFDRLMRTLNRLSDDGGQVKLSVYFVRNVETVRMRLYGSKAGTVAGFYTSTAAGALAIVPRITDSYDGFGLSSDTILFHEYAHHLMLQYFPAAYPAWYVEGFAEFIGRSEIRPDGTARVGMPAKDRAYGLLISTQLPIETVLTTSVSDLKGAEAGDTFYGRSWALVHYLSFERARSGQMKKYLQAISDGRDNLTAAREAFGDLKELDKAVSSYIQRRKLSALTVGERLDGPKMLTVTPLEGAASEAVLQRFALTRGQLPENVEKQAAALRALSAKYPGNAEVLTLLAEAEIDADKYPAALAAADAALAVEPQNARALLWKGVAQARALQKEKDSDTKKWSAARSWIVKANRAANEDPLPLIEYYRSFLGEGKPPTPVSVEGLAKAVSLVPQDGGIRLDYALALARDKKYALAATVLAPVANDPHGGESAAFARALTARIKDAEVKGSAFSADDLFEQKAVEDKKSSD